MSIRTGQTSAQAPQRVEANGSEADAPRSAVELRLQDRPDRPGVRRVVGVAAGLAIDRADVDARRAADAAESVAPDLVRERPRPPVVEQDEVEGSRTVARMHSRPDRGVRVHALAGRRARQQLEHHLQVAERRHDLLDPHHRHEHLGQGRAHPAVSLGLDDDDAPGVGAGEVRARDGHARAEECVAQERARRRRQLAGIVGETFESEPLAGTGRGSRSGSCGSRARGGARAAPPPAARSARPGRSPARESPAASSASFSPISSVVSDFTFTISSTPSARTISVTIALASAASRAQWTTPPRVGDRRLELDQEAARARGARGP